MSLDRPLACDRRVDGMEKAQMLAQATEKIHRSDAVRAWPSCRVGEPELIKTAFDHRDDHRIRVADAKDPSRVASLGVEDAREEALAPIGRRNTRPLDSLTQEC